VQAHIEGNTDRMASLYEEATHRLHLAESLLVCLMEAREECEAQLARLDKEDPVKSVTGKSSLDEKICATTRMVDSLRRVVKELASKLNHTAGALVTA